MPTSRQIRYFLCVAELGGFTPAAASLFIAQPALSRQIAQLEQELGFALFVREPRGVRLTPAGLRFRERVGGLEEAMRVAVEEARRLDRGEAGVLRLLHSSSVPVSGLMPAIDRLLAEAPGAQVDLDRLSSEQQVQEVAGGRADAGLIRLPVLRRESGVQFIGLAADRLWAALPPGDPLAARDALRLVDLAGEAFVSAVHRERGGLARRVTDLCLERGFVPRPASVISRKTSMLTLVAAGYGVAVVPEGMRAGADGQLAWVPLADADAFADKALILPGECSPLARRFAEIARGLWAV